MPNSKFCTHNGSLTKYAFSCGYVEESDVDDVRLSMWAEHGTYHVRGHNHTEGGRVFWHSFRLMSDARKAFNRAKRGNFVLRDTYNNGVEG